ncbi:hypothetical protein [Arthrobacter sp. MDT1-65]
MADLSALALVCTLTPSPDPSSSELIAQHILDELRDQGGNTSLLRVVDHDVKRGVLTDMGGGDQWPVIRKQILAADTMQGLNDVGVTIPAQGGTHWVGEAMQTIAFKDLAQVPDPVTSTSAGLARHGLHLARYLTGEQYPAS